MASSCVRQVAASPAGFKTPVLSSYSSKPCRGAAHVKVHLASSLRGLALNFAASPRKRSSEHTRAIVVAEAVTETAEVEPEVVVPGDEAPIVEVEQPEAPPRTGKHRKTKGLKNIMEVNLLIVILWTTTVSRDVVFDESFITSAEGAAAQPIPILPPPSLPDPPASPVITPSTSHPVPSIQPPDVSPDHALSDSDSDLDVADATPEVDLAPPRREKCIPGWLYSTTLHKRAIEAATEGKNIPDIRTGDIVQLRVEVPENKKRVSLLRGICIGRQNAGIHTTFRIRRVIAGVGVEMVFPLYSPNIKEIKVVDKRKVRRAKLYYLRDKIARLSSC
ncbi:hypothetical protein L7F22_015067 [Adiantum nelumboides]|nr:hypothetical protein [Adiantum nelumboides]